MISEFIASSGVFLDLICCRLMNIVSIIFTKLIKFVSTILGIFTKFTTTSFRLRSRQTGRCTFLAIPPAILCIIIIDTMKYYMLRTHELGPVDILLVRWCNKCRSPVY